MKSDLEEVKEEQLRIAPDDIARKAFYSASLGILRSIRLLVILCLMIEVFGRIIQLAYIYFPASFPQH